MICYTDGSTYKSNPGPISWACVYVEKGVVIAEEMGALWTGTNNKAELIAVIWALEHNLISELEVRSDSLLVVNIASGKWKAKRNLDLWERYYLALEKRTKRGLLTVVQHVKGHSIDEFNRRADQLAKIAAIKAADCLEETKV